MMVGIDGIARNTGSYAGINAGTYPLWRSTSLNASAASATAFAPPGSAGAAAAPSSAADGLAAHRIKESVKQTVPLRMAFIATPPSSRARYQMCPTSPLYAKRPRKRQLVVARCSLLVDGS